MFNHRQWFSDSELCDGRITDSLYCNGCNCTCIQSYNESACFTVLASSSRNLDSMFLYKFHQIIANVNSRNANMCTSSLLFRGRRLIVVLQKDSSLPYSCSFYFFFFEWKLQLLLEAPYALPCPHYWALIGCDWAYQISQYAVEQRIY